MNKSDLIKNISFKIGDVKKSDTEEAVNKLISFITDSLLEENRVEIRGFGSFSSRHRSVRFMKSSRFMSCSHFAITFCIPSIISIRITA